MASMRILWQNIGPESCISYSISKITGVYCTVDAHPHVKLFTFKIFNNWGINTGKRNHYRHDVHALLLGCVPNDSPGNKG
jgi:hypothetical protein